MFFDLNWQDFFDRHYQPGLAYLAFKKFERDLKIEI